MMSPPPEPSASISQFLERLRASFSHDLRSPLGSIVNYATVLESHSDEASEGVRSIGSKIRFNAMRTAQMLGNLEQVTKLAIRGSRWTRIDVLDLARSLLCGGAAGVASVELDSDTANPVLEFDAELLALSWTAYGSVLGDSLETHERNASLRVVNVPGTVGVELNCGVLGASSEAAIVDCAVFMRHSGGRNVLENSLGLALADGLVTWFGGKFEIWGNANEASGLRIGLPNDSR